MGHGPDTCGVRLTPTQEQRLRELGAGPSELASTFTDAAGRDAAFKEIEAALSAAGRRRLRALQAIEHRLPLVELEEGLRAALCDLGFVEVMTPLIIGGEALCKMGVEPGHPLRDQVHWLESGRCLRPMLAPNLYTLMRRLGRTWGRPLRIFEIGSCFRRDSKGARHLGEFTMLDLVEMGGPDALDEGRLRELGDRLLHAAGLPRYEIRRSSSEVYGETFDFEVDGLEVCSAALGPHPLDGQWGILEPWVGLGFGLERLIMAREGYSLIERGGRSLSYVDGVRLNL